MTPEQQRAIAIAKARKRLADQQQAQPEAPERGIRQRLYDNIVGDPDDGVASWGESLGTWIRRGTDTGTLGLVGEEVNAAGMGLLPGRSYQGELERLRRDEENMSTAGRLSADLVGSIAPALMGVGVVAQAPTVAGRMGMGAALGAGAGATQGFMEGEGGLRNRMQGSAIGAAAGGVLGGVIPAVSAGVGHLWRSGQGALRNSRIGSQIGESLGVSPSAGRVVGDMVGIEDGAAMQDALRRAGPDAMLGDASPSMGMNLRAAMQTPNPGSGVARQRVDQRAGDAYHDIIDALTGGQQGPQMPPVAAQRQMAQQARGGINQAYQKAYNTPIDYASEAGRRIEDIVDRLPPSTARKAIQRATDRMIYDGAPSPQIMASIADDGAVTLTQKPNVIQLDYLKRAFDEIAEDGKDAVTGRLSSDGAFASRIARDLREAVGDAVPEYRTALSTAATDIRQRAAVRTGGELLRPQTTIEQAAEAIADATPAELRAMRQGVMGQIDHTLGNVRAVASDQNIEPRQAMQALRELSSPNAQRKMEGLFGDDWPGVKEAIDQGSAALGLRAHTAARSDTAANLLFNQQITDAVQPGPIQSLQPLGGVRQIGQQILGSTPQAVSRARDEVKGEIAELLTRQGGAPQQAISEIARILEQNPASPNAGNAINDIVTLLGMTGLPTATERLRKSLGR